MLLMLLSPTCTSRSLNSFLNLYYCFIAEVLTSSFQQEEDDGSPKEIRVLVNQGIVGGIIGKVIPSEICNKVHNGVRTLSGRGKDKRDP